MPYLQYYNWHCWQVGQLIAYDIIYFGNGLVALNLFLEKLEGEEIVLVYLGPLKM